MSRSEQLNQLIGYCSEEGISIIEVPLPGTLTGAYDLRAGVIYLRRGMTIPQQLATLAHEIRHHELGHDGHQPDCVEQAINEQVAGWLISEPEYALAERLCGGHSGAIAVELDLPRWVVSAYRKRFWRSHVA